MKNILKSTQTTYAILGAALGFGAPLGCLLVRAISVRHFGFAWMGQEMSRNQFYYIYMFIATPIVFAAFGATLGFYIAQFNDHKKSLEAVNDTLKEQSIMDELTGFYNRRHILFEIQKEVERARRYRHTLVGIMLDVDDFKKFNDRYGHLVGDHVLREVASIFDHCIRSIDILGRYGGDEFIVILPEAGLDTGLLVAERIRKAIALHEFKAAGKILKVTVSIGIHFFENLEQVDKFTFIEKIDKSLFDAKKGGKNRAASSGPGAQDVAPKKITRQSPKKEQ